MFDAAIITVEPEEDGGPIGFCIVPGCSIRISQRKHLLLRRPCPSLSSLYTAKKRTGHQNTKNTGRTTGIKPGSFAPTYISRRNAVDGNVFGSASSSMNAHDRHGEDGKDKYHV